jgi:hypothetical protein
LDALAKFSNASNSSAGREIAVFTVAMRLYLR